MNYKEQLQLKKAADNGDLDAMYDYGVFLYLNTPDYETALKYFYDAASRGYALAYGEIGMILYREKDDVENAEKWFQEAVKADCIIPPIAFEYGMLLFVEKDNLNEALKYLFIAAEAEYEPAYPIIGAILNIQNKIDDAEQWFKKAEQANFLSHATAYDYGMLLYWDRDELEQALKYLFIAAKDDYEPAFGDIGIIYYRDKNDKETALKWFKKAENVDCLYPPAAFEYGELLSELGKTDEAMEKYLIAAEGKYDLAYEAIGDIYYQRNDLETADKWFAKMEE